MGTFSGTTRSRMLRGAVMGAVVATLLPWAPSVDAEDAELQPSPTGYYTKTQDPFRAVSGPVGEVACQIPSPDPRTCVNPAQITGGTPGYPRQDNYVYVAAIRGDDDSRGVVGVPLFSVPPGATINALFFDFYVENESAAGTLNFDPDDPVLQLCLITEGWAGQDAAPYDSQPDTDCEVNAAPKKVKEEEREETTDEGVPQTVSLVLYSADLMPMARKWASGSENNGIMIRPTPDAGATYQTAIRTPGIAPDGMTLRVSFTGGGLVGPVAPPPAVGPPTNNAPTFAEEPAGEPEAPPFEAAEPPPADSGGEPLAAGAPVSTGTPWWAFLGLPLGLAMLAGFSRGVAEPMRLAGAGRAGPVSRLMDRGKT